MQINDGNQTLAFAGDLPPEILMEIISRLPLRSIVKLKLVCRAWRDTVESRLFARIHRSIPNPYPHLVVSSHEGFKILEFSDECIFPKRLISTKYPFRSKETVHSSANGLIFLCLPPRFEKLIICNPITREYVKLPEPPHHYSARTCFGFGVSRTSCEYKVVQISQHECQVYTLGTGKWRIIAAGAQEVQDPPTAPLIKKYNRWGTRCAFVGGNLYCLDYHTKTKICCFDLETEVLTTLSPLPRPYFSCRSLSVLKGCLCMCEVNDNGRKGIVIDVWLMTGDGDWRKEYVIRDKTNIPRCLGEVYPIKVMEDGGVLLCERERTNVLYYSNKKKYKSGVGCRRLYPDSSCDEYLVYPNSAVYTPSFLPLQLLLVGKEDIVESFCLRNSLINIDIADLRNILNIDKHSMVQ